MIPLRARGVFVLAAAVLSLQTSQGAFERLPHGGTSVALGGASVGIGFNSWGAFANPGAIGTLNEPIVSLYYVPQYFGLPELSRAAFSFAGPTSVGVLAISGSKFGFDMYHELTMSMTYAMSVSDALSIGANVSYYSLAIQNYGNARTLGVDVGVLVRVTEGVDWGFAAANVNAPSIGREDEPLPQVFSLGAVYQPVKESRIAFDIVKDLRYTPEIHLGIEYRLMNLLDIRAGTSTDPSVFSGGLGIHASSLQIDYAFSSHLELGITHHISFSVSLGKF